MGICRVRLAAHSAAVWRALSLIGNAPLCAIVGSTKYVNSGRGCATKRASAAQRFPESAGAGLDSALETSAVVEEFSDIILRGGVLV